MKKLLLPLFACFILSSCATIFTSSKQPITFTGPAGTKIYDASNNIKLAEIGQDQTTTVSIKKKRDDKQLIAKKDGYKSTPLVLESSFNTTSLWNILFWPGFFVDMGTGQMNKYDNTIINIEMESEK